MFQEVKESGTRDNVVDLAIRVIGAAFSKINDALVVPIIMPIMGAINDGLDFSHHLGGVSKGVTSPVISVALKKTRSSSVSGTLLAVLIVLSGFYFREASAAEPAKPNPAIEKRIQGPCHVCYSLPALT